ncbi:MAG TPA: 4Fe-4S binding protein, partial [Burkholderiales bacterium]|nr:4Fe-4S binding protein [Burkholderiales bacterium]
ATGSGAIGESARRGRGLPAHIIPMERFHVAAIGLDTLLGAVAYGAHQVFILASLEERSEYADSINATMQLGETILHALGYAGRHFALLPAEDGAAMEAAVWQSPVAGGLAEAAPFNLSDDKRGNLQFIFDHLSRHAPQPQQEIALAPGAPYGAVRVDKEKCTLCMACVSACPSAALLDGRDAPALKFIERNCLQCNLCVQTCPEEALSLLPRLSLAAEARKEVQLHAAEPCHCLRCAKAFGTQQMVDAMLKRLASHSMFSGEAALRRLQMCPDCRVMDMMEKDPAMLVPR